MRKAKCPPSLTAWTNDVWIRWGGGKIQRLYRTDGWTNGRRVMQYPPSATSFATGDKYIPKTVSLGPLAAGGEVVTHGHTHKKNHRSLLWIVYKGGIKKGVSV